MRFKYKCANVKKRNKELRKLFKKCKDCNKLIMVTKFYKKDVRCKVCSEIRANNRYTLTCQNCGVEFKASKKTTKFCCRECGNKYNGKLNIGENNHFYGKHHTEETKRKMSDNHANVSGENNPMYGKNAYDYMDDITKQNKKEAQSKRMSRENHPNWNPNKTNEERENKREIDGYYNWRKEVYERDNYTCQCCGDNKGGNLNAHHIYGYSEYEDFRTELWNGITLCKKCHDLYHSKFGYKNINWDNFKKFLFNI